MVPRTSEGIPVPVAMIPRNRLDWSRLATETWLYSGSRLWSPQEVPDGPSVELGDAYCLSSKGLVLILSFEARSRRSPPLRNANRRTTHARARRRPLFRDTLTPNQQVAPKPLSQKRFRARVVAV